MTERFARQSSVVKCGHTRANMKRECFQAALINHRSANRNRPSLALTQLWDEQGGVKLRGLLPPRGALSGLGHGLGICQ